MRQLSRNAALAASLLLLPALGCGRGDQGKSTWPVQTEEAVPSVRPPSSEMAAVASDACLLPVGDGTPTSADLNSAWRMVSWTQTFPDFDPPMIHPLNRGGQWTIDQEGRYSVFPGPDMQEFLKVTSIGEMTTGRAIAAADGWLWELDRTARAFSPLAHAGFSYGNAELIRVERLDLTLVIAPNRVLRLTGRVLEPWDESDEIVGVRDATAQAFDLPGMHAVLFATEDGDLRIRRDDGRWLTLGSLKQNTGVDRIERLDQNPTGRTALLRLRGDRGPASRHLAIIASADRSTFRLFAAGLVDYSPDQSGAQVFYADATDEVLRFSQPDPDSPVHWSRLTPGGYETFEGVAPERNGNHLWLRPASIPRRSAVVIPAAEGLGIYRAGVMRLAIAPDGGLGPIPDVVDLPSVGRTLIHSRHGLFELTDDDRIVRLTVPFSTGGLPHALIYDDTANGRAVIIAAEGQFVLNRDGSFRRVRGARPGPPAFADKRVLKLQVSQDDLLLFQNALWLLVSPSSERWETCLVQS